MKGVFKLSKYKVDITGINTSELKSLKNDEMYILFREYQNGNKEAKDKLVEGNLLLVLSILKRFNNGNKLNMDDLFQIGCIGLVKAIDNFDLSHGVMFSTYAVPLILGEVKRYIRDNTPIRVSRGIKDLAYTIIGFKEDFTIREGREPTNEEISESLGIPEYKIAYALDALKEPMSIFEPIYNDGGDTIYLLDQVADKKDNNTDKDLLISLRRALDSIKQRERDILFERYIVGKTQMELAENLGISQAQISRIEKAAINHVQRLIK